MAPIEPRPGSRSTTIEFEGAIYNVPSWGVARMPVFVDGTDRVDVMRKIGMVVAEGLFIVPPPASC